MKVGIIQVINTFKGQADIFPAPLRTHLLAQKGKCLGVAAVLPLCCRRLPLVAAWTLWFREVRLGSGAAGVCWW